MTRTRHTFSDVTQILQGWIEDAENTLLMATRRENLHSAAWQEKVREIRLNLPKARKALKALHDP